MLFMGAAAFKAEAMLVRLEYAEGMAAPWPVLPEKNSVIFVRNGTLRKR
jgi:hypothetical protein